jgi:hypothetical protein
MKCRTCRQHLLTSDNPALPAREVADHLSGCPDCREWQRRLLRIEDIVARIPVPPSQPPELLLRRILGQQAAPPALPARPRSRWLVLGGAGLAAAAVLIATGIFLGDWLARTVRRGPHRSEGPAPLARVPQKQARPAQKDRAPAGPAVADPLVARLLACDLNLAQADTPRQRVENLAALADELQGETRALADVAGPDDLRALAGLYERVVRDGVVARAGSLPAAERRPVLAPIADRLERTRRDLQELARAARPASADTLRQLAEAAGAGDSRLRALMGEQTP